MPWPETDVLDQRTLFMAAWLTREESVIDLCRRFNVSRKTGHKWIGRFKGEGRAGLDDRSRAPLEHPNATPAEVVANVLQTKQAHPTWGPRKVVAWLGDHRPGLAMPAASTAGEILKRHGMVRPRKRGRHTPPWTDPLSGCNAPNETWSVDFKGWFRTGDRRRCDPLTVEDGYTRFLLGCDAFRHPGRLPTRTSLERLFREYGMPATIRTDNGPPFASVAVGGLSKLSVWWIKLGIVPERIPPGRPDQNGRHERMHRTLKEETASPPEATLRAQQKAFDRFRKEYNEERPHEALGQKPPASLYRPSERGYPRRIPKVFYPDDMQVRRVRSKGEIKWRGKRLFLSEALIGELVGIRREGERHHSVYFGPIKLCLIDDETNSILKNRPREKTHV